jgi:uncharacterized low-complexity protein
MSADRLIAAVASALLAAGVNLATAQHAPAPPHAPADKGHAEAKPAESKAAEPKAGETKAAETKPKSAAPATNPATAVEQILRKLSQDRAKTKTTGKSPSHHAAVSHAAPPPRLQLAWRISLTWPDALTARQP